MVFDMLLMSFKCFRNEFCEMLHYSPRESILAPFFQVGN